MKMKRTILVKVQNHPGMLSKVSGLFSRRAFNIHSLAVGVTEDPSISCMTIVVDGDRDMIEQVEKQVAKLVGVLRVKTLEPGEYISKELVFIKVPADARTRAELIDIARIFGARIAEVSRTSLILEFADTGERIEELEYMLSPYGHCEVVRTGSIAIEKDAMPKS